MHKRGKNMSRTINGNELYRIVSNTYKDKCTITWHGKVISVRAYIPPNEELQVVKNIIEYCISDGKIMSEFLELSKRANIIQTFTNIELPADFGCVHKLLYCSDLYDQVRKNICPVQLKNIDDTVNRYVVEGL